MSTKQSLPDIVKIKKRNISTEIGPITLKYINPIKGDKNSLISKLRNADHLAGLLDLFDEKRHGRVIIKCDEVNSGISAVGQIGICIIGSLDKSSAYELEIDFEDDDFFSFGDDYMDEDLEDNEDNPNDNFIIINESEFDPESNNVGELSHSMPSQPIAPKIDYTDFKNIIFVCDGIFSLTKNSIDFLLGFEGNVALVIPNEKMNERAIAQLTFERDFEVISINKPSKEYFERQFINLASEKGLSINKNINLTSKITELIRFRGIHFQESDLIVYLDKISRVNNKELKNFDILYKKKTRLSSKEMLDEIIGLDAIKDSIYQGLYKKIHINKMLEKGHDVFNNYMHMAFEGNPGTCKTTMARAVAQLYLENNIVTNSFYECGREDIVGKFLGETSHKVSKLFKMARGGTIFIDEIGSLLNGHSIDSYGEEALSAIVRHMENSPETMVIIATYPKEMERLLGVNPGLRSRLSKIIHFPDYGNEELIKIFDSYALRSGYSLEAGYEDIITNYFTRIMAMENFGNGREARKLFEHSIAYLSVEQFKDKSKYIDNLTLTAISSACNDLLKNSIQNKKANIGFAIKK